MEKDAKEYNKGISDIIASVTGLGAAGAAIIVALLGLHALNAKAKNSFVGRLLLNQDPEAQGLNTPGAAGANYHVL